MENRYQDLLPLYLEASARGESLALATLIDTAGSTYRKTGSLMLIARDGRYAGLLSGGCLEGDLAERARAVIDTGLAVFASFDMRGPDDALWGLGSGCEGAMRILLGYCGPNNSYAPLPWLRASLTAEHAERFGIVIEGPADRLGFCLAPGSQAQRGDEKVLWIPLDPPPVLVICGAGPDSMPVAELGNFMGWRVFVFDHRSAYAKSDKFGADITVGETRPQPLAELLDGAQADAVVVMSHHLETDRGWLECIATHAPRYVGLLGPAPRREKILRELSAEARAKLEPRLRAPVGLDLGGRSPASIALAIIGEIQAVLHGRAGEPFSRTTAAR